MTGFAALQRFAKRPAKEVEERCDLCGAAMGAQHGHLLEVEKRRLVCACRPCNLLFGDQAGQRYRRVPERVQFLEGFQLTDGQWDSLLVPINMAFFYRSSKSGNVSAMYPSPAGATESQLPLDTWRQIEEENPSLQSMESDVEALLVNRLGAQRGFPAHAYYLVPIDRCFHLVGLVRTHWRGLSGGQELWEELRKYFEELVGRTPGPLPAPWPALASRKSRDEGVPRSPGGPPHHA
jgi:Family of unknown function (DUF5947)